MNKLILISLFALILINQSEAWKASGKKKDALSEKSAMNDVRTLKNKLAAKDGFKDYDDEEIEEYDEDVPEKKPSHDEWKYAVKTIVEEVEKLLE